MALMKTAISPSRWNIYICIYLFVGKTTFASATHEHRFKNINILQLCFRRWNRAVITRRNVIERVRSELVYEICFLTQTPKQSQRTFYMSTKILINRFVYCDYRWFRFNRADFQTACKTPSVYYNRIVYFSHVSYLNILLYLFLILFFLFLFLARFSWFFFRRIDFNIVIALVYNIACND